MFKTKVKSKSEKLGYFWKFIFWIIPIPAILGLLNKGFFDPHDMHHLADIYEMYRAVLSGQLPPRLGPDFSFGYTYPLFNYYYLFPFYLGAFFYWLLGSLTWSFKIVLILSVILSYFGMFKFLRLHFNKLASIAGAALFVYTPYRAVQIYVRGSLGEVLALSLLPWVLYLLGKYLVTKDNKYIAIGSIVYFLLIISHNYFFVLFLPIILFYTLAYGKDIRASLKRVFGAVLIVVLGIGAASYWLIPALMEKKLVRSETPFLLADHFPFIKQLLIPSWGYGSSVWGPTDEISFQIGIVNLLAIVGLTYVFYKMMVTERNPKLNEAYLRRQGSQSEILRFTQNNNKTKGVQKWFYFFTLGGFIVGFIFMNIRTLPIWNIIPFHDLIQFPWRLLNFTTFFSTIALAGVIEFLKPSYQRVVVVFTMVIMLVISLAYFHPNKYFYKSDQEYLNLFFNTPGYSEDYLLLPIWVKERPPRSASKLFESQTANIKNQGIINLINGWAQVESDKESQVIANVYYFPGWNVLVNDVKVKLDKVGDYGIIGFNIPKGDSKVLLLWEETPLRKNSNYASIIFIIVIGSLYLKSIKEEKYD